MKLLSGWFHGNLYWSIFSKWQKNHIGNDVLSRKRGQSFSLPKKLGDSCKWRRAVVGRGREWLGGKPIPQGGRAQPGIEKAERTRKGKGKEREEQEGGE